MITVNGFSKDPSIIPEGIAVTFGLEMMNEQGGPLCFIRNFEMVLKEEGQYWLHKCKNRPRIEVDHVYIICMNRLYCRCFFGGYSREHTEGYAADGTPKIVDWPHIILAGPIEKPPFKRILKGFQGPRYTTKLF